MGTSLKKQICNFIESHQLFKIDDSLERLLFSKRVLNLGGKVTEHFNPLVFEIVMRDIYFLDYENLKECLEDLLDFEIDIFEKMISHKFRDSWVSDRYSISHLCKRSLNAIL